MRVLHDNLLVIPVDREKLEVGSLIYYNKPTHYVYAEIVIKGEKTKVDWKVGDVLLLFKNHTGVAIDYNGLDCILVSEQQCVARENHANE